MTIPLQLSIRVVIALCAIAVAVRLVNALRHATTWKQWKCVMVNGDHELYRAHDETRLFQSCFCGYETPGITIDRRDRRDRRLHLVAHRPKRRQILEAIVHHMPARRRAG